MEGGEFLD